MIAIRVCRIRENGLLSCTSVLQTSDPMGRETPGNNDSTPNSYRALLKPLVSDNSAHIRM